MNETSTDISLFGHKSYSHVVPGQNRNLLSHLLPLQFITTWSASVFPVLKWRQAFHMGTLCFVDRQSVYEDVMVLFIGGGVGGRPDSVMKSGGGGAGVKDEREKGIGKRTEGRWRK